MGDRSSSEIMSVKILNVVQMNSEICLSGLDSLLPSSICNLTMREHDILTSIKRKKVVPHNNHHKIWLYLTRYQIKMMSSSILGA